MPDPREEAVAPKLQALIGSYRWTDVGLKRAAAQLLAAADAVDPIRNQDAIENGRKLAGWIADLRTRAETAEAACETSGAALVVMNDLLKEAEADRDRLRRSHDSLQDSSRAKIKRLLTERDTIVEALEEIVSGPDASKGEGYGCLDLHEARYIARTALAAVKGREDA